MRTSTLQCVPAGSIRVHSVNFSVLHEKLGLQYKARELAHVIHTHNNTVLI